MYHKNNYLGITVTYKTQLLTPPREEEEIQPYHKAWRPIIIQSTVLVFLTVAGLITGILGISIPSSVNNVLIWLVAFAPLIVWFLAAYIPDRAANQPRTRLLSVFIISALAAQAITIPFIENVLQVETWISLISALERIVAYSFTVGITQASLFYVVLRTTVWKAHLRNRYDIVAYAQASATGYLFIETLHFATMGNISYATLSDLVLAHFAILMSSALIIAYGISISKFDDAFLIVPAIAIGFASFSTGLALPLYTGLTNTTFTILAPSTTNPFLGVIFASAFINGIIVVMIFLMSNAERTAKEVAEGSR